MEEQCSSPGTMRESGKPIRVIDVAATIGSVGGVSFKKPDAATDFHVIAHTWSREVRDFSKQIGALTQSSSASTPRSISTYNDAFRDANFSESDCYKHLKDFLKMLMDDGVEYAWFDALCIDQTNDTEKDAEIARMASYCSESKGCYVLNHGLGKGYSFWQTKEPARLNQAQVHVLPRWFERAWTLQEYLLPTKLTFLVEFDRKQVIFINRLMKWKKCGVGFCKCYLLFDYPTEMQNEKYSYANNVIIIEEELIDERDEKCEECGSFPLVRKAMKKDAKEMVYFVDRDAYTVLSQLLCQQFADWEEQHTTVRLLKLLLSSRSPMLLAWHIAKRKCSNEEDRVLGLLGPLGSSCVKPVRTGDLLEEQILSVCEQDHELLIQLCAMSIKGYCKPGMSWAPWLVPDDANDALLSTATESQLCPGPITKRDVEVVEVSSEGIELYANITKMRAVGYSQFDASTQNFFLQDGGALVVLMHWHSKFGLSLKLGQPPCEGYVEIPLQNLVQVCGVEFEMWWILLGDTRYANIDCKVVMACVGKDATNLHKIGLFWISSEHVGRIFFQTPTSPRSPCFVGGFGEFLDEHVTPSSKKLEIGMRYLFPLS